MAEDLTLKVTGYSDSMLRYAFGLVEDKTNWKNPICAAINADQKDVVAAAIEFHTGSKAKFTLIENTGRWLVEADGYYKAVGA